MKFYIDFKDLPFEPSYNQVIYVENGYDTETNDYIRNNYKILCETFESMGYEFCYLPLMAQQLASKPIADYYAPYNDGFIEVAVSSDLLLNYMILSENRSHIEPSLLYWDLDCIRANRENTFVQYRGFTFKELITRCQKPSDIAWAIFDDIYRPRSRHTNVCHDDSNIRFRESEVRARRADTPNYDEETRKLLAELQTTVAKLHQKGIATYILEQMVQQPAKLSRLVVTSDCRILLPDYKNTEIEMTPLAKAVYLLFLNHPEGIVFKSLPDYYYELLGIYVRIRKINNIHRAKRSIEDITDPTSNSINVNCARIRAAFVGKFDERLAQNYIIQGERGEAKRILLPQELIERQDLNNRHPKPSIMNRLTKMFHMTDMVEMEIYVDINDDII